MSYRPICDTWILGRCKHGYYGGYPAGFLHRGRQLLGVGAKDAVLHVCSGGIKNYPYRGLGKWDQTLDLDPSLNPDFLRDARLPLPLNLNHGFTEERRQYAHKEGYFYDDMTLEGPVKRGELDHFANRLWDAIMIDRPYTEEDADHYFPGRDKLPTANELVRNAILAVPVGGKVGILDYLWPQPPKNATEAAVITVTCGRNNRARFYTVFERLT